MGNWWDAATQNMPSASYGQLAQQPQSQGMSGIFGTNGGAQNASVFANSSQFNPYASSPNWMNPQGMSSPEGGQYPTMSGITGGNGNSNAAAQGNLAQFYAAQAANSAQRNSAYMMSQPPQQRQMSQSPYWQTGGGDPGNGQVQQLPWETRPATDADYQRTYGSRANYDAIQAQPLNTRYNQPYGAYIPGVQPNTSFTGDAYDAASRAVNQRQQQQMQPGQGQNQLMQLLQQIMQQRGGGQQQPQGPQYPGRPTPWNDIVMQQGQGGQYSYPGAQQGQPPATNLGMAVDPQLMQRIMTQRQAQQQSGLPYWSDTMSGTPQSGYSNSPGEQWRYQQPQQQPPSGMSQQMPAFIQQLMQQRMQQQQMQQMQQQQGGGMGLQPERYGFGGNGMNTGMGMQQQSNPFLQMLMQMQQRQQPQTGGMTTGMGGY